MPVSLDWSRREVTLGAAMQPTGDLDADVAALQRNYRREMALNPEEFWDPA